MKSKEEGRQGQTDRQVGRQGHAGMHVRARGIQARAGSQADKHEEAARQGWSFRKAVNGWQV